MNALYWITVLGNLQGIMSPLFTLASCIVFFIFCVLYFLTFFLSDNATERERTVLKNTTIISAVIFTICILVNIFVPSQKELYAIYGAGTVIDYVQKSPEVKKLPNDAVKALDIYFKEISKECKP